MGPVNRHKIHTIMWTTSNRKIIYLISVARFGCYLRGRRGGIGWLAEAQIYIFWVEWIIRDLFKTHRKLYWEWVWDNHVKLCISMIRGIMIFSQRKKSTKKGDTVFETSRMEIMLMRIQPRPYNVIFASNSSVHSIFYTKVEQDFP